MKSASLTIFFLLLTTICLADETIDKTKIIDNDEEEQIYSFALDVVQSIKYVYDSEIENVAYIYFASLDDKTIDQGYRFPYMCDSMQSVSTESLRAVKHRMERWAISTNISLKVIADELMVAIHELVETKAAFLQLCAEVKKNPTAYNSQTRGMEIAACGVRLTSSIMIINTVASCNLIVLMVDGTIHKTPDELWQAVEENKPIHFKVSKKHLESILKYIDYHFEAELDRYYKCTKKDRQSRMTYDPLYAIASIRNVIKNRAR